MKWATKSSKVLLTNPYFTVRKDQYTDSKGVDREYLYLSGLDGVIIVPIRVNKETNQVSYIMVEQYRYPTGDKQIEFPKGGLHAGEDKEAGARRELLEEVGLEAKWMKFMHSFYPEVGRDTSKISVYLALVDGEPSTENLEPSEIGSELRPVEVSSDELIQMIKNNEIRDGHTLAALSSVMLQSEESKKYFASFE